MTLEKEKKRLSDKLYYQRNRERIRKRSRNYREANIEQERKRERDYQRINKEIIKIRRKGYYSRENVRLRQHLRYEKNREWYKEWSKLDYRKNKDKIDKKCKIWRENNPERSKEIYNKAGRKIRSTISGKLNNSIGKGMYKALKENKAGRHWETFVDYDVMNLKNHLESLFTPGMTWDNYGRSGWHIDHIKPRSLFHYKSVEDPEFKKCWSLDNLQPLWAVENIRKSNKYGGVYIK